MKRLIIHVLVHNKVLAKLLVKLPIAVPVWVATRHLAYVAEDIRRLEDRIAAERWHNKMLGYEGAIGCYGMTRDDPRWCAKVFKLIANSAK